MDILTITNEEYFNLSPREQIKLLIKSAESNYISYCNQLQTYHKEKFDDKEYLDLLKWGKSTSLKSLKRHTQYLLNEC